MKITFSNLGAIKKTTLDLRPLTVIIGPNNSNKTYIAYSIYGLWQMYRETGEEWDYPVGIKIIKESSTRLKINLDDKFYDRFIRFYKKRIKDFKLQLETFFQDSTHKLFKQTNFEVEISKDEIRKAISKIPDDDLIPEIFGFSFSIENNILTAEIETDYLSFRENSYEDFNWEIDFQENISYFIRHFLFQTPFLMPAERNAFIITYKMLANRRYKHLRQTHRELINRRSEERQLDLLKEQGDIRYPQPIEDFLDFLTDVELETSTEYLLEERIVFKELAEKIEESIQEKNKTNLKPTKLGGREILINVKKGLNIDLYNASSSIKQLAPLLLYLRYRAKENDLLIIDEPEMNLHPESQAKLLEVLGMLVNAGVNVLLTTHSPYFMSHLNNLINGDMSDEKIREKQAKSLYLEDARAFLDPDDVSAYEMKKDRLGNQTLHDLKDKDYGIRWDTLSDVSADIQQKFFEIYEKGEDSSNGKKEKE
jgi:predicted ATPase